MAMGAGKPKHPSRWKIAGVTAVILSFLGTAVYAVLNAALNGIIGNRADATFVWLSAQLGQIDFGLLPWLVVFVVVIVLVFLVRLRRRVMNLEVENQDLEKRKGDLERETIVLGRAFATQHNMVLLDDTLFRLLASQILLKDHEVEKNRILTELLSDATVEFSGHVHRAMILLPKGEYLKVWAHLGMPEAAVKQISFYIGPDRNRLRGVAGEAFVNQRLCVGHMMTMAGGCVCDDANYTNSSKRPYPPYQSFVVVPIIGMSPTSSAGNAVVCLGVICFDSLQSDIFDSDEIKEVLRIFARRVAAVLLIFQQLP